MLGDLDEPQKTGLLCTINSVFAGEQYPTFKFWMNEEDEKLKGGAICHLPNACVTRGRRKANHTFVVIITRYIFRMHHDPAETKQEEWTVKKIHQSMVSSECSTEITALFETIFFFDTHEHPISVRDEEDNLNAYCLQRGGVSGLFGLRPTPVLLLKTRTGIQ